jgi:hypothetical protein
MSKRIADGKKNFISLPFLLFKISSPGGVEKQDRRCRQFADSSSKFACGTGNYLYILYKKFQS